MALGEAPKSQTEVAKAAVENIGKEVAQSRKQAREQRAADRLAKAAKAAENPDKAYRVLAYGEGEGLRQGADWQEAKKRASEWRDRAKSRVRPLSVSRKPWDKLREDYRMDEAYQKAIKEGLGVRKAEEAAKKEWLSERSKLPTMGENFREVKGNLGGNLRSRVEGFIMNRRYKDAISAEEKQLRYDTVASGKTIDSDVAKQLREEARINVRAAGSLEKMQAEKVKDAIKGSSMVDDLLNDRLAQMQSESKRPITRAEKWWMRRQIANELYDRSMENISENEVKERQFEREALNHPKFQETFENALSGIDITTATPDQINEARNKALLEMRDVVKRDEENKDKERSAELTKLRQTSEWKKAYTDLITSEPPETLTSERMEILKKEADWKAKFDQAEKTLNEAKADFQEKNGWSTTKEGVLNIAKRAAEATDPADKATQEKRFNDKVAELRQRATDAKRAADADPANAGLAAEAAKSQSQLEEILDLSPLSKSSEEISDEIKKVKDTRTDANGEIKKAKDAVTKAELAVNLLTKTDIPTVDITEDLIDKVDAPVAAAINQALKKNSPEEQKKAIEEAKKKHSKLLIGGGILALIFSSLLSSLGKAAGEES